MCEKKSERSGREREREITPPNHFLFHFSYTPMSYSPSISALSLTYSGGLIAGGPGRILGKFWRREASGTGSGRLQANVRPRKHTHTHTATPSHVRAVDFSPSFCTFLQTVWYILSKTFLIVLVLFEPKPISRFFPCVQSAGATRGIICLCSILTVGLFAPLD